MGGSASQFPGGSGSLAARHQQHHALVVIVVVVRPALVAALALAAAVARPKLLGGIGEIVVRLQGELPRCSITNNHSSSSRGW